MLKTLHIENIAVIERADVEFSAGLSVLTGETGAGKSIIIDSLNAVLGNRVSRELVRSGADRASVTASFESAQAERWCADNEIDADDGEIILQRRISTDGKSTGRVNGVPVTASQLRELGALLLDIHGQNDGRQLLDERRHLDYLDAFGECDEALAAYRETYDAYRALVRESERLSMDEVEKQRLEESLRYRIAELSKAEIRPGEEAELTERRDLLRNSEKLTEALDEAFSALYGGDDNAVSMSQNAAYYAAKAANYAPELEQAANAVNDAAFALADAAETLRDFKDSLDFSPEEYDNIETRLSLLNKLERKYGRTDEELCAYLDECRKKLDDIEYADDRLVKLEKELSAQKAQCVKAAAALSAQRREKAAELEKRIVTELRELNMPSVRFAVEFVPVDNEQGFDASGADKIRFIMSANAGEELGRISKIASGGELSRIMLAMKNVFAENDPVGTMVFDEIDTGVSGIAAQRVAEKLFAVSKGRQVMCVTHLPQIAAMADSHYLIAKHEEGGRTYTEVNGLTREGRRRELARLHGGDFITETTLASAEEQLAAAEAFKKRFS